MTMAWPRSMLLANKRADGSQPELGFTSRPSVLRMHWCACRLCCATRIQCRQHVLPACPRAQARAEARAAAGARIVAPATACSRDDSIDTCFYIPGDKDNHMSKGPLPRAAAGGTAPASVATPATAKSAYTCPAVGCGPRRCTSSTSSTSGPLATYPAHGSGFMASARNPRLLADPLRLPCRCLSAARSVTAGRARLQRCGHRDGPTHRSITPPRKSRCAPRYHTLSHPTLPYSTLP